MEYTSYTTDTPRVTEQNTFPSFPSSTWFQRGGDDNGQHHHQRLDSIVSDSVVHIVEIVIITIICGIISTSGIVANVINILVFFRQGALSSSSNVSLLALAFADIGCLVPVFCNSINYALFHVGHAGLFLTPRDFMDTLILWPHIMCMQIASWITAYIAFERCICVLLPLKVKFLFSAKRSAIITASIALIVIASFLPTYMTQGIAKVSNPATNKTALIFMATELHVEIVEASDVVHAIVLRPLSLLIVFVCTQVTIYRVKLSASWRKSIVANSTATSSSSTAATPEATNSTTNSTKPDEQSDSSHNVNPSKIFDVESNMTSSQVYGNPSTYDDSKRKVKFQKPQSASLEPKEARLVNMITMISVIFMVCNAPDILGVFALISIQTTYGLSLFDNLFSVIIAAQLCLESFNSAINIIVYYRMSSSYKHAFRSLIGRQ